MTMVSFLLVLGVCLVGFLVVRFFVVHLAVCFLVWGLIVVVRFGLMVLFLLLVAVVVAGVLGFMDAMWSMLLGFVLLLSGG